MFGSDDVQANSTEGKVLVGLSVSGEATQRVTLLLLGKSVDGIAQKHICVEGIIFGRNLFLTVAVVHRNGEPCLLGQEASQIEVCGNGVVEIVLVLALGNTLLNTTKTRSNHLSRGID